MQVRIKTKQLVNKLEFVDMLKVRADDKHANKTEQMDEEEEKKQITTDA